MTFGYQVGDRIVMRRPRPPWREPLKLLLWWVNWKGARHRAMTITDVQVRKYAIQPRREMN